MYDVYTVYMCVCVIGYGLVVVAGLVDKMHVEVQRPVAVGRKIGSISMTRAGFEK